MMRRAALILLGGMLPGCTLIDQNTFNPAASAVPVIPPAPVVAAAYQPPGPAALLTIRPGQPAGDAVRQAVAAARRRKPDVMFDVVAALPADTADEQAAQSSAEASAVAQAIGAAGVASSRIRLSARPEPGLPVRETRVYVR